MSKEILIELPVKPYVKSYLDVTHFLNRNYTVTTTDIMGIILISLLNPTPKKWPINVKPPLDYVYININLGANDWIRTKTFIPEHHKFTFNRCVETLIEKDFLFYMDTLTSSGIDITSSIRSFQNKFFIREDELAFETLKKRYYRYRNTMQSSVNQ